MAAGSKRGRKAPPRARRRPVAPRKPADASLKQQLAEARAQQTATAEILRVISSSPADVQPVLEAVAERAARICDARVVDIVLREGDMQRVAATFGDLGRPLGMAVPLNRDTVMGRSIVDGKPVQVADLQKTVGEFALGRELAIKYGHRSILAVPLMRESGALGTILVRRAEVRPFDEKHVALLQTFADQAAIAIENARLFNETREALERQTATAEILKVIAGSPSDVQPMFEAIVASAMQLLKGASAHVTRLEGRSLHLAAYSKTDAAGAAALNQLYPLAVAGTVAAEVLDKQTPLVVSDVDADPRMADQVRTASRARGVRSFILVPLVSKGASVGTLVVNRREAGSYTGHEIGLLQTFADQAVIAIENVRLFNETKEALERQTATADILKVIASSRTEVQPVFDAIVQSAARLFGRKAALRTVEADGLRRRARSYELEPGEYHGRDVEVLDHTSIVGQAVLGGRALQWKDTLVDGAAVYGLEQAKRLAFRSIASAPLMLQGRAIGVISVSSPKPGLLSDKQMELLATFADQAVIAIENVRLFNETREALERQTATAEILRVIASSPSDVQPVFDAIAASARRLLGGDAALVARRDADMLHLAAYTSTSESADAALRELFPSQITGRGHMGRAVLGAKPVWVEDVQNDTSYSEAFRASARIRGVRSVVSVPMLREGEAIGVISVNRSVAGRFSEHQTDLLRTFADQAVIAIENVRLFNETKEALERQTATAEILKVISSSPTDTQPVFDAIVRSGMTLFSGAGVGIGTVNGGEVVIQAALGMGGAGKGFRMPLSRESASGLAILERKVVNIPDTEAPGVPPHARENGRRLNIRSMTQAPMFRDGEPIGSIGVMLKEPGGLDDKQISLLKTFADQAVIAIENVRLFNETKEALEQQTATAEILQVISSSPTDTQPVFEAIVQAGLRLFPDSVVVLGIPEGAKVRAAAVAAADAATIGIMRKRFPVPLLRDRMHAAAILDGELIDVPDAEAAVGGPYAAGVRNLLDGGYRAITIAPMICGDAAIGAISVSRPRPGALSEKQVALLRTFAAQAVIAIENVRVFKELEARTSALTRSVEQLTALGEVGQAISSTLDLETVLKTIVQRAVQLTGLDGGSIYEYDETSEEFQLRASENLSDAVVEVLRTTPMRRGEGVIGHAVETGEPTEIPEMLDDSYQSPRRDVLIAEGYRALLVVPLLREEHIIGALAVNRRAPGLFSHDVVELLKTFATQSAMAIQNARLFREIAEKGKQLEVASRHKSDFLASMSHELRTPLNAILGFNEMILGQIYGEVPGDMKEPLEDIQKSGKHLLRLINNVLDLAKIEAGRMELSLQDYSVHDTVESVRATLRPLAAEKGLEFLVAVPPELPLAYGDAGRIAQCLMNLAGNSLKFTRAGKVEIAVAQEQELLTFRVADTGIGIPQDKIGSLFTEFKQTDATIASEYGGTGLGLSISKKFVEMHGGRIWIESELGKGSVFIFEIPLRVQP